MFKEIGSYDAKTKLPEILRCVRAGESFTITNRGKPVADIVPSRAYADLRVQAVIDQILTAKKHLVTDADLADLRQAGRR